MCFDWFALYLPKDLIGSHCIYPRGDWRKGGDRGSLTKWRLKSEKMVSGDWAVVFFVVRTEYEY